MICVKKFYATSKYYCCVLVVFALFSISIFAENAKPNEHSGFILDYNYYGFPFFVNAGYTYKNNSSQLLAPLVGISAENGKYSFDIFANAKMEYRYKRFYFQLGFKQGLIPYIGQAYKYEYLESYGQFMIGHFFENIDISYCINVGNMYALNANTKNLANIFQVNHSVNMVSLLYNDAAHTISLDASANIETIPYSKQYSYNFSIKAPYTFYHYWGEFGIMPSIKYSNYFVDSKKGYAIGNDYFGSIGMQTITADTKTTLYNFLSSIHLEYKFYFRFLPDALNSLYLVGYANLGYGKEIDQTFEEGKMLYTVGGGIGYNVVGMVPLQLTLGVDRSNNIVINFVVSTIMHDF